METYRFKPTPSSGTSSQTQQRRRLLLPLSGGVCSLVLLEVLDRQIKKQLSQQGRTAYELVICHVDIDLEKEVDDANEEEPRWLQAVKTRYPSSPSQQSSGYSYEYLPTTHLSSVLRHDPQIEHDLSLLGITRHPEENDQSPINRFFQSAKTATTLSDLHSILLTRLSVALAKSNNCEAILYSHSDTALAARTLASVAKGRGASIPAELSDGPGSWGPVEFRYPLRDLFGAEVGMYLDTLNPEVRECLKPTRKEEEIVNLRGTSIDVLMERYIRGQGVKYPGIMANVVRTAGKLSVPNGSEKGTRCRVCGVGGVQEGGLGEHVLCYGCERMKQDIKT